MMNFCIATVEFWQAVGFNTDYWRASTDGEKAICHDRFAKTLVDIENNEHVQIYGIDDEEFKRILEEEFTSKEEI